MTGEKGPRAKGRVTESAYVSHQPGFDGRRYLSSGAPILFDSAKQQRFLAFLAHFGPSRPYQVTLAMGTSRMEGPEKALVDCGLILWQRAGRERAPVVVSLNPGFPGIKHLAEALRLLEPASSFQTDPDLKGESTGTSKIVVRCEPDKVFGGGSSTRTRVLVAIHVLSKRPTAGEITRALDHPHHQIIRRALSTLVGSGVLTHFGSPARYEMTKGPWRPALARFLNTINRELHIEQPPIIERLKGEGGAGHHRTFDYRKPVVAQDKPTTFRPPKDGAPLLFMTDARRRTLSTLESGKPVRAANMLIAANRNDYGTASRLAKCGLAYRFHVGKTQFIMIHPRLPAREEFVEFLRQFNMCYPPMRLLPNAEINIKIPRSPAWRPSSHCLFGTACHTEALVMLALVPEIYPVQLAGALPTQQPDSQTLRRFLDRLTAQGILLARRQGVLRWYSFNDGLAMARQLRRFLIAFAKDFPQYATLAATVDQIGSVRSRKLRKSTRTSKSPIRPIDAAFNVQ